MTDNLPERREAHYLTHADVDLMFRIGKAFAMSKFFEDAEAEAKAFVIISAGRELGLLPFQSFQYIDVIKGKPVLNAQFFASMIRQHPHYDYHIVENTNERCEIQFLRDGEILGTSTFDQGDAKQAELDRPGRNGTTSMYVKFPRNMLFSRALSNGAAWYCPDVLGFRAYVEGELEDEYLETKAEREAQRAAEKLALEQAKAAAGGTAPPAAPVAPDEPVVDVEPEPEMDTAVKEPMKGTASATLDREAPMEPDPETAALEDAPEPEPVDSTTMKDELAAKQQTRERTAAQIAADKKPAESPSTEKILTEQEQNVAKVRQLVVTDLKGEDRKECHDAMKYLSMWGEGAALELWKAFGKKALEWKTLKPALAKAVKDELARVEKLQAEAPPEPPFGGDEPPAPDADGQERIVDVEPEPEAPWAGDDPS